MIREATVKDLPKLAKLGADFWRVARAAANLPGGFVEADWCRNWERLCASQLGVILELDDESGAIGVLMFPDVNDSRLVAQEAFWWVSPEARGRGMSLLSEAEKMAKSRGCCRFMTAHIAGHNDRLGKIYKRMGYTPVETSYVKNLWQ